MSAKVTIRRSNEFMPSLLKALGMGDHTLYTRVVLVFDCDGVPKVYATKVVDADSVLKVVETLNGAVVEAASDDTVEVIQLTEAK